MPIPGLGLGIADIAKIGADAYNAKSIGELQAERLQKEEEARKEARRREALESALTELNIEKAKVGVERDRVSLDRVRQGLAPTPAQQSTRQPSPPSESDIDRKATRAIESVLAQNPQATATQAVAQARSQGATDVSESALRAAWYRQQQDRRSSQDDSDIPSAREVEAAAQGIVHQFVQMNPELTPEQMYQAVTGPQADQYVSPAIQLLIEGGRITPGNIRQAYGELYGAGSVRGNRMGRAGGEDDDGPDPQQVIPEFRRIIDQDCRSGVPPHETITEMQLARGWESLTDEQKTALQNLAQDCRAGG